MLWSLSPHTTSPTTLSGLISSIRSHGYSTLVVDDDSPDGTGDLVDDMAIRDAGVSLLRRSHKAGIGPAYAAGFAHVADVSAATVICQMDADFSHDPRELPAMVALVTKGADLVIGSRYVPGGSTPDWPFARRMISRGGNVYARALLGGGIRDMTGGFRAWSPGGLAAASPGSANASGYAFQVETAWRANRAGCTVVEHPITFRDRIAGESKMDGPIVREAAFLVAKWGIQRITRQLR